MHSASGYDSSSCYGRVIADTSKFNVSNDNNDNKHNINNSNDNTDNDSNNADNSNNNDMLFTALCASFARASCGPQPV